ncbi:C4-dicarboxylate TRAP transporter substrate-binding protein [Pseudooceanicola sp.]|jgi:TRAP-type C4-dicarboxylate transport system substrate-binding protein|uniref:C4-dicarboxylate TRAP transporter substrate-binding protein n=1 Tax=Pseudooceanicola TaxID=1679449 RepID=UPI0035153209
MTIRKTSAAALAALSLTATPGLALEMTYGAYTSPTHTTNVNGIQPTQERITEATNGEITFETFAGGAMGGPKELLGNVGNGILDSASVVDIYVKSSLPVSSMISSMLAIGDDPKVMAAAVNEFHHLNCPQCKEELEENNVVGLSWSATGAYHVICKEPIKTLADLQGRKIRATSGIGVAMQEIGAAPVSITTAEMYEAMQRGQIDCAVGATAWLDTYNLKDFAKGVWSNALGSYFGTMNWAINQDVWNELTEDQRQAFKDNMAQAVADIMWAYVDDNETAMEWLKENGGTVEESDQAFKDAWAEQQAKAYDTALAAAEADGIENAEELLNTFKGLVEKWTARMEEIGDDKAAYQQALQDEIFSKI